jgi:GT2 family glycosyltransferase
VWPPLSIIWVNYNSMGIMDIVLRSLKSILKLEYPDYEVIVVDNASSDGSFEKIRDLIRGKVGSEGPSVKLLRLRVNKGYAGGVTKGFKARDGGSKYVVVMNNNVIVLPEALKSLVELAEQEDRVDAVNGVLLSYQNPAIIDSAGGILNELLTPGSPFSGWSFNEYRIRRPYANLLIVGLITNSRFKAVIRVLAVKRVLRYPRARLMRALRKELKLGVLLRDSGLRLNLYRAPIALMSGREVVAEAIFGSLGRVNARIQAVFEKEILKSYS